VAEKDNSQEVLVESGIRGIESVLYTITAAQSFRSYIMMM
jgi:hypothetical protein